MSDAAKNDAIKGLVRLVVRNTSTQMSGVRSNPFLATLYFGVQVVIQYMAKLTA